MYITKNLALILAISLLFIMAGIKIVFIIVLAINIFLVVFAIPKPILIPKTLVFIINTFLLLKYILKI